MTHPEMSNPEKLEEVYRLTIENNHLLHKIQNRSRITAIFQILYWAAIVGALGGAYYYVRPLFESITANSSRAEGVLHQFEELRSQFPESKAIQDFISHLRPSGTSEESEPAE